MTTLPITAGEAATTKPVGYASGIVEAVRYLAASIIALCIDASLLALGVRYLQMQPWLAGGLGYLAGLIAIYGLSVRWVFRKRAVQDRRSEFALFALIGCGGLLFNSITLQVMTGLGMPLLFAKGVSATIGFVTNYVGRKIVLFSKAIA